MNKKFNIIILLLCLSFFLSACKTKQYETMLLINGNDAACTESDVSNADAGMSNETEEELKSSYFVHICGAVLNPGVYEVSSESRVFEVLNLAGGFTDEAATDAVNLAMLVIDGSKIQIPTLEEVTAMSGASNGQDKTDWGSKGSGNPVNGSEALTNLVNINTASLETLMTLPGIGKVKAESIILYREEKGRFTVIEDIMKITGIKDAVFGKIKDRICV